MSSFALSGLIEIPFQIDSITPIPNPNGGTGSWHQYVISQGPNAANAIRGQRSGSMAEVNAHLLDMVEQLNVRFGKLKKV
jgi:hypothetical protein